MFKSARCDLQEGSKSSMSSSIHSLSENSETDEQQQQSETQSHSSPSTNGFLNPGITSPPMFPYGTPAQLGVGNAQTAYPYADPYYRSIFAPYETQPYPAPPMAHHLHMMGMQQAGVPLPTDSLEEPVFVNAKQYHGILRRRQSRAKAELENKLARSRKPYLHESRHLHALRRSRGVGGRFQKKNDNQNNELESNDKSHDNIRREKESASA